MSLSLDYALSLPSSLSSLTLVGAVLLVMVDGGADHGYGEAARGDGASGGQVCSSLLLIGFVWSTSEVSRSAVVPYP